MRKPSARTIALSLAAAVALAGAGCEGRDIDTIVTVSSTGIATPSLAKLMLL